MNKKRILFNLRFGIEWLFMVSIAFMQYSCNKAQEERFKDYKNIMVTLDSNIGSVSIKLPPEFDTSYKCLKYSDCGYCCASINHCYASKTDQTIFEDTIHDFQPVIKGQIRRYYSFTVIQSMGMNCSNNGKTEMTKEDLKSRVEILKIQEKKVLFSKIDTINNRKYLIFATIYPLNNGFEEELSATTIVNNEPVNFRFLKTVDNKTDFIQRMYDCLMTLKINDKQK